MVDPNPLFTIGVDLDGIPAKIDNIKDQLDPKHAGSLAEHVSEELDPATVDGLRSRVDFAKNQLDRNYSGSMAEQLILEVDPKTVDGLRSQVDFAKNQLDRNYSGSMAEQLIQELDPKNTYGLKSDVSAVKKQLDEAVSSELDLIVGLLLMIILLETSPIKKVDQGLVDQGMANAQAFGSLVSADRAQQLLKAFETIRPDV